jgi:hypothetical protein
MIRHSFMIDEALLVRLGDESKKLNVPVDHLANVIMLDYFRLMDIHNTKAAIEKDILRLSEQLMELYRSKRDML